MNCGLSISASGVLASLHRQDVLTNNLANINTVGFKPDDVVVRPRLPQRLNESDVGLNDPALLLQQLGGWPLGHSTRVNLRQGDLLETHNDLDLGIEGEGFFVVGDGRGGADRLRFTRDGRFTLNAAGELVMTVNGMRVLDVNDQAISLNRGTTVNIDADGNVAQNGTQVAKLQVRSIIDATLLRKEGNNAFKFDGFGHDATRQAGRGAIRQGYVESSAVDPIMGLNAVINASKAVQANATMMQYHDNILGQAINTLGRVA